LHEDGNGPFCEFKIPHQHPSLGTLDILGVYALVDEIGNVLYIGECSGYKSSTLKKRFNNGYGHICPRACYKGGQSTNCYVNNKILTFSKQGHSVSLFFHETPDSSSAKCLEANLLNTIPKPPWNRKIPSFGASVMMAQKPTVKAASLGGEGHDRANIVDPVREEAIKYYFEPARERGDNQVVIVAHEIQKRLPLPNRYPAVCNALEDKKGVLQQKANIELVDIIGKNPSSATQFIYRLL